MCKATWYVIARENNIVRVDFTRGPNRPFHGFLVQCPFELRGISQRLWPPCAVTSAYYADRLEEKGARRCLMSSSRSHSARHG